MAEHHLRYQVVDVFTREPLEGNPLAVFLDGSQINSRTMQRIARELNLSETVFVLPSSRPDCIARLRIFTPLQELPFAGHPTIGTAFVLLQNGTVPREQATRFSLEEGIGVVPVRVDAGDRPLLWLTTPPILDGPVFDRNACAAVLGLDSADLLALPPQILNAGNPTLFIPVKDTDIVDRAAINTSAAIQMAESESTSEPFCFFVFAPTSAGAYSRMFAPSYGILEDPATGSSTGPLAEFMMRHNLVSKNSGTRFVSEQGTHMGRRSLLHVLIRGESGIEGIDVGGQVTPLIEATLHLSV